MSAHHSTSHIIRVTNFFLFSQAMGFPIHRTLSTKTKTIDTSPPSPKEEGIVTQKWIGKVLLGRMICSYHSTPQNLTTFGLLAD